jgi:antitoxin FitA
LGHGDFTIFSQIDYFQISFLGITAVNSVMVGLNTMVKAGRRPRVGSKAILGLTDLALFAIILIAPVREEVTMPDLLVRDIPGDVVEALKKKAAGNRRSLQQELKLIIENAAKEDRILKTEYASLIKERLQAYGKEYSDSTDMLRTDRNR